MDNYWEVKKQLPNILNQKVIDNFLLHLKLANRGQGTIIQYREFITLFFSQTSESFSSLTPKDILDWFTKNQEHIKETTYRFRLSILSSFYKFCVQEAYIEQSPIISGDLSMLPQPLPLYFEREESAKTRSLAKLISLRNQLLFEFMLTTGCQGEEVSRLNRRDLDIPNRTARVVGQGRRIRYVHFADQCAYMMGKYINGRRYQARALFTNYTGKRLSVSRIHRIVRTIGVEAGLKIRLKPHQLSQIFSTELLARGMEIPFVRDELNRGPIKRKQIYTQHSNREIITLYHKFIG